MVASHVVWLMRTREVRKQAKENGETFDESTEGVEWQAKGMDIKAKLVDRFASWKGNAKNRSTRPVERAEIPKSGAINEAV